ncbi:MAG TPA: hypothetical protein DHV26_08500 [Cytophagales bacterium]|nr:hypothetical protein [Cytophagales bacterium]HRG07001.1 hypothetical protein [Cyclobacteriaceae bacterium]
MKPTLLLFALFVLGACTIGEPPTSPAEVEGFVPIYGDAVTSEIKFTTSRTVKAPGKIYTYGTYLLINEVNQGIHIYENSDPTNPTPLGFIEIVGNTDMAIRNNILYANHLGKLVALNVANLSAPQKVGEVNITNWLLGVPPPAQQYFQCVDPTNGIVIGWKKETLRNPECYAL